MRNVAPSGKIKDWVYRVDCKETYGYLIHIMLWLEDAPIFGLDDVIWFIDKIITCEIPIVCY